MTYRIDAADCINCSLCRQECPTGAVEYYATGRRVHTVNEAWCIDCDLCAQVCPVDCIVSLPDVKPPADQLERARDRARQFARRKRAVTAGVRAEIERVAAIRGGQPR